MQTIRTTLAALTVTLAVLVVVGAAKAETAGMVTCKDGATSKGGRGACHGHGGVAKGTGDASGASGGAAAASSGAAAAPMVTCKDGATSKGGRGACRGHGGVAKAGDNRGERTERAASGGGSSRTGGRGEPRCHGWARDHRCDGHRKSGQHRPHGSAREVQGRHVLARHQA